LYRTTFDEAPEQELFCVPVRAGTRCFPSTLREAVSDPGAAVIRKACKDSFTFEKEEKRVKEFDKWLKREVRDIMLSHINPVYIGEGFALQVTLPQYFLTRKCRTDGC
jgi:phage FluMu gp28-like protein